MAEIAKIHQDQLARIKKDVEDAREYFEPNYKSYHASRKFIFKTSLTGQDIAILTRTKKPDLQFNIQEAYISRLRGEFSKQEPSLSVSAQDDMPVDEKQIEVVDGHIRHIMFEANKQNGCEYNTYTETLSGGFSVWKVWTEYANPMSFHQVIKWDRAYDPTLTGFDPLARNLTKNDGRFCFELFPILKEQFEKEYPNLDGNQFKYSKSNTGFSWSYRAGKQEIVLICDFYEKKKKKVNIVWLANGNVLTQDQYDEEMLKWDSQKPTEQPANVILKRRTEITTIVRYRFVENMVLEYTETDYEELPLIFVDGNSQLIRDQSDGPVSQITRSYVYHLEGTQRLKNFAGQTLAGELQNMVTHKWVVAKEAIPAQYLDAYKDNQVPNVLIYNHLMVDQADVQLPPPREVMRPPIPQEITNTFMITDQLSQVILGSYDASLGVNDNQLSGVAIVEGATQSNSAAMPYVVGYMQALNQLAACLVSLIPKIYTLPRHLPVRDTTGKKNTIRINGSDGISMKYMPHSLSVKVEAGVSFSVQKQKALQAIIALMNSSPLFAEFINSIGLEVLLDNLEIRGIDRLKELAAGFMKQQQMKQKIQMQQMQQQMNHPNPLMLKAQTEAQKVQLDAQQEQHDVLLKSTEEQNKMTIESAKVGIAQQEADTHRLQVMAGIQLDQSQNMIDIMKQQTERTRSAVDMAIDIDSHQHEKMKDHFDSAHKIAKDIVMPSLTPEKLEIGE